MDTTFNASSKFAVVEVTNIFQQNLDSVDNVYEFKHSITVHKAQAWLEDVVINPDSVGMTFEQAYNRAKQSDLVPSKSKYMVLRNPLGPVVGNPYYIIGKDMFIDTKTSCVSNTTPAMEK